MLNEGSRPDEPAGCAKKHRRIRQTLSNIPVFETLDEIGEKNESRTVGCRTRDRSAGEDGEAPRPAINRLELPENLAVGNVGEVDTGVVVDVL